MSVLMPRASGPEARKSGPDRENALMMYDGIASGRD
jgi:hypothetical protein